MAKIDNVLSQHKTAERKASAARKRLEKAQREIAEGKKTTGDPIRDFCFARGIVDGDTEKRLKDLTVRIADAKGQHVLVHTRFAYAQDMVMCHGFGAHPEYESDEFRLSRLARIGAPSWNKDGLTIPCKHYAFSTFGPARDFGFFREYTLMGDWDAAPGPLFLGTAELLDSPHLWPGHQYGAILNEAERTDFPETLIDKLREGPLHFRSEHLKAETSVLLGDDLTQAFETNSERYKEKGRTSLRTAIQCIRHGMSPEAYAKARETRRTQYRAALFTQIVTLASGNEDDLALRPLLRSAARLGVHKSGIEHSPRRGITIEAAEYLPDLYERHGIAAK